MLSRLRATFRALIMRRQNRTDNPCLGADRAGALIDGRRVQVLRDSHRAINRAAKRRHAERMQAPRVAPPAHHETITIDNTSKLWQKHFATRDRKRLRMTHLLDTRRTTARKSGNGEKQR